MEFAVFIRPYLILKSVSFSESVEFCTWFLFSLLLFNLLLRDWSPTRKSPKFDLENMSEVEGDGQRNKNYSYRQQN